MSEELKETVVSEQPVATPEETAEGTTQADPQGRGPRRPRGDRRPHKNFREKEEKIYEERVVDINRISKTVQGGRRMRFSALVVIGDGKGKYGFATAKANEVPDAIKKSLDAAKRNVNKIAIVRGDTIPHEITGEFGATKVYLKPAPEGTGIVAGGPVRAILELAGIKNVVSKVYGARAAINIIRATHDALSQLKSYSQVKALRGLE